MRVLFDTDVLLDVLLRRQPFFDVARSLFARVERGELDGALSATSMTTVFYLARKSLGRAAAVRGVGLLLKLFRAAPITHDVLTTALDLGFDDYEDAVLHEAARTAGVDGIVTRNTRDFSGSQIPIYTPAELEGVLRAG
jgi:predicted nucleic acid-binding protein